LIGAEQFAAVRAAVADLLARVDQTLAVAQEQQLKEERRQYIVEGLVQAMRQLGFIVQGGTPALEHAGVPASATIIQAERLGGGAIAISVPQEGDIWYDVGGYPMRLETGGDGQPAHTCDEAENQIEQMHAVLNEAFGIQMGELMWDGKNPTRISRQADRLPDTAQGSRQKEGL
jgi:hypothetical protein